MNVAGLPSVKVHLLQLAKLEVIQGFVWATCHFTFQTAEGSVIHKVDGIPNERAVDMANSFDRAWAAVIADLVSSSKNELEAWMERVTQLLAKATPDVFGSYAVGILKNSTPPPTPGNISWDSIFNHPEAAQARKRAESWPDWKGTPSTVAKSKAESLRRSLFIRDVAEWVKAFIDTYGGDRWIPKSAVSKHLNSHPVPAWPGNSWEYAMKGLCKPENKDPHSATSILDLIITPEVKDLGHGVTHDVWRIITRTTSPSEALAALVDPHNPAHLKRKRHECKEFFDTVDKNPLTDEQIHACVCMDDHVMVVAAAGSGKTSTMVAKTGYVLHERLAKPNQILLLAFNVATAREVGERIAEQLADVPEVDQVKSKTFHSFGIDVIADATGKKPTLAPWVDPAVPNGDIRQIAEIAASLSAENAEFRRDWAVFRTIYGRDIGKWGIPEEPDAYADGNRGFLTANGEIVKSKEERTIADWLFYHQIDYVYERAYEHDTATQFHRQYYPDFYYPEAALYHEHYALNANGDAPEHFKDYIEGVKWKRMIHAEKGTTCIETTSFALSNGTALRDLEDSLRAYGLSPAFDGEREAKGLGPISNEDLARTIRTFQQHVKNNGLTREDLHRVLSTQSESGFADRLRLFLAIYERVAAEWERRLRNAKCIDFEDMLVTAAELVESGRFQSPYTVILADEFQDSSRARIRLLKALAAQPKEHAHLCVVGDDWQGINRFAGSDISVMTEFESTFDHSTRLTLTTTFRCPQHLCDVSSEFVQANPAQIRKDVTTTNPLLKTPILAFALSRKEAMHDHVADQLASMRGAVAAGKLIPANGDRVTVMLLGRYRDDIPAGLGQWQNAFGDRLKIEYRTAHGSKGLEAEYVFVLNVVQGTRGFPSQIQDDPVLQLAMPAPDPFPYAEERRLFYVAMTRARKQVRFYTTLGEPSQFIVELATNGRLKIEPVDGEELEACPACASGVLRLREGVRGAFQGCSRFPSCDFTRSTVGEEVRATTVPPAPHKIQGPISTGGQCPVCKQGTFEKKNGRYGIFLGCTSYPSCRATAKLH
ncbi:UvrD-helicase domain-containing protein [Luteimonas sp. A537]